MEQPKLTHVRQVTRLGHREAREMGGIMAEKCTALYFKNRTDLTT